MKKPNRDFEELAPLVSDGAAVHWEAREAALIGQDVCGALATPEPFLLELQTPYEECLPLMPPGKSFDDIIV